jgi:hypothetical protein
MSSQDYPALWRRHDQFIYWVVYRVSSWLWHRGLPWWLWPFWWQDLLCWGATKLVIRLRYWKWA